MDITFKILGAIGLLIITYGIFIKKETQQDVTFMLGGVFLLAYSIYLRDPIFIPLQIVFILASGYEIWQLNNK